MACQRVACVCCLLPLTSRPCCWGILYSPASLPVLGRLQNQRLCRVWGFVKNRGSPRLTRGRGGPLWRCTGRAGRRPGAWDHEGWGPCTQVLPATTQPSVWVCSAPTNRLTSQFLVPRGNLVGSATNGFLCVGRSEATCLYKSAALEQVLPTTRRRGESCGDRGWLPEAHTQPGQWAGRFRRRAGHVCS